MKKLAVIIALAATLFTVAAIAPSAVTAKVPTPIVQDACACGGSGVAFTYEWCSSPDFVTRTTVYTNGYSVHTTWFDPDRC